MGRSLPNSARIIVALEAQGGTAVAAACGTALKATDSPVPTGRWVRRSGMPEWGKSRSGVDGVFAALDPGAIAHHLLFTFCYLGKFLDRMQL
ncbi:hypothetical protein ColTof3_01030 [Colletotrichum tofieldiae]|nr:hypothetical protein ColTof3_01030 [Colletotrichum tofieldiae]